MNLRPCTVEPEASVVAVHRAPGREVVRQLPPRTAGAIQVKDRVNHFAQIDGARPSARLGRGYRRLDQSPLLIRQVRGVGNPFHTLLSAKPVLFTHVVSFGTNLGSKVSPILRMSVNDAPSTGLLRVCLTHIA